MKKTIVLCLLLLAMAGFALAEERIPVAENDHLALFLAADHCGFEVLDKETGVTWSSSMNDPSFTGKLAGLNEKKANSLLTVNVTTLAQADTILDQLAAAGVEQVRFSLKGWAKGGYGRFPDRLPVEGSVGKNQELTALMKKAEAMGSTLSLTANFVEADDDSHTYSKRNDVVYFSNYAILTDPEEEIFVLSPHVTRKKYDAFAQKAAASALSAWRSIFPTTTTARIITPPPRRWTSSGRCSRMPGRSLAASASRAAPSGPRPMWI